MSTALCFQPEGVGGAVSVDCRALQVALAVRPSIHPQAGQKVLAALMTRYLRASKSAGQSNLICVSSAVQKKTHP